MINPYMGAVFLLLVLVPVQPTSVWPTDQLINVNGATFQGLILDETDAGIRFRVVRRPPGRPTVTITSFFPTKEILGLKRLKASDRAKLIEKLGELDAANSGERKRAEELTLKPVDWLGKPNAGRRYESEQFVLISSAPEEITRRAAVRLEQIYTAYGRFLPSRVAAARPTTVLIAPDQAEYIQLLGPATGPVLNPALFDPAGNRVIAFSDLRKLGSDLDSLRVHHVQQLAAVEAYEAKIQDLYKNARTERERHLETVGKERAKVYAADKANDAAFDKATARLFALLYHEAFHAYVGNDVYPPRIGNEGTGELPRWLNEGLAQIFETAVLDGGELRVGHVDRERLLKVQEVLKNGSLVPLGDLIRAGKESFVAAHADQKAIADRTYLTTWAVAQYLMFEKRVVGTASFAIYLTTLNTGGDPRRAFETLVSQDVLTFEVEFRTYMLKLQPDGTLRK